MHRGAPEGACPEQTVNTNHSHASFFRNSRRLRLPACRSIIRPRPVSGSPGEAAVPLRAYQAGRPPAQAAALYNEVKARTSVPGTYFLRHEL